MASASIPKDNRLRPVDQDAILDMIADAASQCEAFAVSAEPDKVLGVVVMFNAGHLLFDDRSGVQLGGGVMTRGADEFHPAFERSLVGICPDESRQKGVVNVDDSGRIMIAEPTRQNLHEPREHDQFCSGLLQQAPYFVERIGFSCVERDKREGNLFALH